MIDKIDLQELEAEQQQQEMLNMLDQHEDSSIQTLAQGEFKGKWYFGKQLDIKSKKVDAVVLEDGSFLVNMKMQYPQKKEYETKINEAVNAISDFGFRVGRPLLTPENFLSKEAIKCYISDVKNVVSVVSLDSKNMEKRLEDYISISYTTTLTTLTTQTTQTTQEPKLEGIDNKKENKVDINRLDSLIKWVQDYYMDVYDEKLTTLTTYYIIATYLYELFDSIGYLFLCSDSGTGKTKWASIIQSCSFNSINATNTTESAMFRIVEQSKGTLFIDDYEKIEETKKNSIDQLLKVGYKKGGKTCRSEKVGDTFVPVFFDVYCPKVITNTEGLDSITYSRCIPLHLIKTMNNKGKLNPKSTDLFWQSIRDCCYYWALVNWKEVKQNYASIHVDSLNNRDLELVKPILAVAKTFGEDKYEEVLGTVEKIFDNRDMFDFSSDWDFILFNALHQYFESPDPTVNEWIKTKDCLDLMLQHMNFDEDDKKRPSVKWVGRLLSRIDLFEKKREAAGVKYRLTLENVEKYMRSRGWIKA